MTLVAQITGLLVEEKTNGAIGNQTPVLHGSRFEVRDGNQVHLGEGVCDAKKFRKVFQGERGNRESKLGLLSLSRKNVDTAGDGLGEVLGHSLDVLKLSDNESNQLKMTATGCC